MFDSDRHAGLLNAADEHINGFSPLVHIWCMQHFAWLDGFSHQRKKEICEKVKALCCLCTEHQFKETMRELDKMLNEAGKAWLDRQMEQKAKWALA
jgi:hypothetical protein